MFQSDVAFFLQQSLHLACVTGSQQASWRGSSFQVKMPSAVNLNELSNLELLSECCRNISLHPAVPTHLGIDDSADNKLFICNDPKSTYGKHTPLYWEAIDFGDAHELFFYRISTLHLTLPL